MSIYQRCLSKSLIFFSVFFLFLVLFIESNIGFKWIFNFTSRFFIGLKAQEISGNWRDFTLKNIKYNIFGISITANSIHVMLDTRSLFNMSTIFKEIETKNLIISLKKNISSNFSKNNISSNFSKNNISSNFSKNNIFIKYPVIFRKIHADKISFRSSKVHIFFFNVLSGIKLINNNIVFLPTHINTIHLESSKVNFKKKNILSRSNFIGNVNDTKKIYRFLNFFSNKKKIFIPLNINLMSLKCNRIKFIDYKNNNLFKMELQAQIDNSVLKIKKIKINSAFFKIKSHGNIFFYNDYSISFFMKNKIVIPKFYNRIINFSLKANLNAYNKFRFRLKSKDLYKIKFYGSVLLNSSDYPFFIKLQGQNLFWTIKKDCIFELNSFNGILKGKIDNYFLSLKNIFTLTGFPSIFINIEGQGNFQNIFLKKINFSPIKKKKYYKEIINLKDNVAYNHDILEFMGKINISGESNKSRHDLRFSKINLDGNIMKKKFSILGSIYYRNFNFIEIPGIKFFLGKNKLDINGSLGKKYNIHSSIYANNLDYFLPDLKGEVTAKVNFSGDGMFPVITSKILANHLKWNNTSFKNIKIFAKVNTNHTSLEKILIDAKKIHFYNFYINTLKIQTNSTNYKQNFSFLLKSHRLYMNLIINGFFNKKTGNWHGFFKRINIQTFLGQVTEKKNNLINYYDSNNNIKQIKKKNIKKKEIFSSFLYNAKTSFFNIFNQSLISFKSELSIKAKFRLILGRQISDGKIFLIGHNIKLEKKIQEEMFIEKIDYFKTSIYLIKNHIKSTWIVKKLKNKSLIGYLDLIDMYNKKILEGKFSIYDFPFSFINFFTTNFKKVNGIFSSKIKFFGTLYQPKVSADVSFKNIFIRSDNILQYITLFFPYFLGKTDSIKINQEIIMQKGNVLFTLKPVFEQSNNIEWNLLFNSKKISILIFPKMKLKFSSQLNLHYLFSKYDLIGYIKFPLFYFKINEKNFIF